MHVHITDNTSSKIYATLSAELSQVHDAKLAVAFVSKSGLDLLHTSLDSALAKGATIEFLVGLDLEITNPDAIEHLLVLSVQHSNVHLYCYASNTPAAMYHPKLYLLRHDDLVTSIIGSSNLTPAGLLRNIEINAVIQGTTRDVPIIHAYEAYSNLKFLPGRFLPDKELVELYRAIHTQRRKAQRTGSQGTDAKQLREEYSRKLAELRRMNQPQPSTRDITGWRELVYDSLPQGDFTTAQAYTRVDFFRQYFPNNANIKAKIRQQLQMLRDLGFLEHLGRGLWRRL